MAKIFESQIDVEREKVIDKIKSAEQGKKAFLVLTLSSALLSSLYFRIDSLEEKLISYSKGGENLFGDGNIKGLISGAIGVVSAVMWGVFGNEARKLKKTADKLGPEHIIPPKQDDMGQLHESYFGNNEHVERLKKEKNGLATQSFLR
ncbi:MAG: hypothetical protein ABS46_14205 [Cytophagaceae bacterium SCN 52-12]|nr:MAG: hypothetical protein ABS46_14205 [Cytophagaceae bacterium SCN 52-12]